MTDELREVVDGTIENVKATVENIAVDLGPEEDWDPMAFMIAKAKNVPDFDPNEHDGEAYHSVVVAFDFTAFPDFDEAKDAIAGALEAMLKEVEAEAGMWLSTSWTVRSDHMPPEAQELADKERIMDTRPSEHPYRSEVVTLIGISKPDRVFGAMARVVRHEDSHPTLEDWDVMFDTADENADTSIDHVEGRFPDALKAGLGL